MRNADDPVASPEMNVEFVDVAWRGRSVRLEYQWTHRERVGAPLMVFLHEGLGSLAMWKDFPARLCAALDCRGLVYSRPAYGRSTPREAEEAWGADFMHQQAHEVLPALLQALSVDCEREKPWLFGHSDGGTIALLHAARFVGQVGGVIVLAPHIMVEDRSVVSIEQAKRSYLHGDLRTRLRRYHDDPDSAFWGWNRIWLDPRFRQWTIEAQLGTITCAVLAVQGVEDEYGTLEQVRGIARKLPHTELLELPHCGHSPHRDQGDVLIAAARRFFLSNILTEDTRSAPLQRFT